jgi:hypothetical protein
VSSWAEGEKEGQDYLRQLRSVRGRIEEGKARRPRREGLRRRGVYDGQWTDDIEVIPSHWGAKPKLCYLLRIGDDTKSSSLLTRLAFTPVRSSSGTSRVDSTGRPVRPGPTNSCHETNEGQKHGTSSFHACLLRRGVRNGTKLMTVMFAQSVRPTLASQFYSSSPSCICSPVCSQLPISPLKNHVSRVGQGP